MNPMDPRASMNAYGAFSPPPTAKNTMSSPGSAGASPARFPQVASPSPNPYNRVDVFQQPVYTESPAPMQPSPYPIPSSQSTMDAPPDVDAATWVRAMQHIQRTQQQQLFQSPPPNMMPPNAFPPRQPYPVQQYSFAQQPHFAQQPFSQQSFSQDSGYGSGIYDNLGQAHGLPGRQHQNPPNKTGHKYGKVTATGEARVIRGNARDSVRPVMNEKEHDYGDIEVGNKVHLFDGDVTTEQLREFYFRR